MRPLVLTALLATACTGPRLATIPIEGGDAAQREAARDALVRVARDLRPSAVPRIDGVVFDHDVHDQGAAGQLRGRTVALSPTLDPARIPGVVRHELCHAWDEQDGYDAEDRQDIPVLDDVPTRDGTPWRRRAELFALLCEHGREGVDRLRHAARPCLPDGVADVLDTLAAEVYRPRPAPRAPDVPRATARPDTERASEVTGWFDADTLVVRVRRGTGLRWLELALDDATFGDRPDDHLPGLESVGADLEREGWTFGAVAWPDDGLAVRAVAALWGGTELTVALDPHGRPIPGACVPGIGAITARSRVVLASVHDDAVHLAELTEAFRR